MQTSLGSLLSRTTRSISVSCLNHGERVHRLMTSCHGPRLLLWNSTTSRTRLHDTHVAFRTRGTTVHQGGGGNNSRLVEALSGQCRFSSKPPTTTTSRKGRDYLLDNNNHRRRKEVVQPGGLMVTMVVLVCSVVSAVAMAYCEPPCEPSPPNQRRTASERNGDEAP